MKIHRAQQKGRDFVHQRKIEIDVNDRAVSGNDQTALSFTPTSIDSLSVCPEAAYEKENGAGIKKGKSYMG